VPAVDGQGSNAAAASAIRAHSNATDASNTVSRSSSRTLMNVRTRKCQDWFPAGEANRSRSGRRQPGQFLAALRGKCHQALDRHLVQDAPGQSLTAGDLLFQVLDAAHVTPSTETI